MEPGALAALLQVAEPLLRASLGEEIRLHGPRLVKDGLRCRVIRCAVTTRSPRPATSQSAPGSLPTSVIVKQIKPGREAARGYTDWASLAFLTRRDAPDDASRGAELPLGESVGEHPESTYPPGVPRGAGLPSGGRIASPQGRRERAPFAGREPGATGDVRSVTCSQLHGDTSAERELGATSGVGLAPRFLCGDAAAGVYVIEDLGGSLTLDDLLNGDDAGAVWDGMRRLAVQAARLNTVSIGREAEFLRMRADLPGADCVDRRRDAEQWLAARPRLEAWFAAVDAPLPTGFEAALALIASAYADPGPFLAFTHGDFAPSNNHVAGEEVRLLDFEYGGFRHALYDVTAWNVLCPLPEPLVDEIRLCYRAELARTLPEARDDTHFELAWATLSAYRALAMLTWIPCAILEANRSWVGEWSAREAVLAALARLAGSAMVRPELEPITEAALALETRLRSRWPDYGEVLPAWPALPAMARQTLTRTLPTA